MYIKYVREFLFEFKMKVFSVCEFLINFIWWWYLFFNNVDDDGSKVRYACNFILLSWWYVWK